jgi:hypothetical protein
LLPIAQNLTDKGIQAKFRQLFFEKKIRKSKKKIQSLISVTFNDQDPALSTGCLKEADFYVRVRREVAPVIVSARMGQ